MFPVHFTPSDDAVVVDIRDQADRDRDGILPGAVALDAAAVIARLVPGLPTSLRTAHADARWVLISSNGATAAAVAGRLRDRGVRASAVDGGFRALTLGIGAGAGARSESLSESYRRTLAQFAAHEA